MQLATGIRVTIACVYVWIVATSGLAADSDQTTFHYTAWRSSRVGLTEPGSHAAGYMLIGGHIGYTTGFCRDDSEFFCFRSAVFDFAIPKKRAPLQSAWEHLGRRYQVVEPNFTYRSLGRTVDDAILIEASPQQKPVLLDMREGDSVYQMSEIPGDESDVPDKGCKLGFVFSRSLGLLAIAILPVRAKDVRCHGSVFWLEEPFGFAATPRDQGSYPPE